MFIFDELILEIDEINSHYSLKKLEQIDKKFVENPNQFIFSSERAIELGASPFYGFSCALVTDKEIDDEIYLLGDDFDCLKKDTNYARIVISSINKDLIGEGNNLYNNILKFDYVKFRFALNGLMLRESSFNKKESLLISKQALKDKNMNFSLIGSYFISLYKKLPFINNVKIIFINLEQYPYDKLLLIKEKSNDITKALDHISKNIKMDCKSCSLQIICNEVEKKVNEDFKKK